MRYRDCMECNTDTKICSRCKKKKKKSDFSYGNCRCKGCLNEIAKKKYRDKNEVSFKEQTIIGCTKRCGRCEKYKKFEDFCKGRCREGLQSYCKSCFKDYEKEWQEKFKRRGEWQKRK